MLSTYAEQNARGFILIDEKELPDYFEVQYGYTYVAVSADGEVKVINSPLKGTVLELKFKLQCQGYNVVEIRTCNLMGRRYKFATGDC